MVKKGKHFSGKVTPLFASMLVQPTEDEGAHSERPNEPQTDSSPAQTKTSGGNLRGFRSSQRNTTLESLDQKAQETSYSCNQTPQSMAAKCFLEAKIGKKEIFKETKGAQRVFDHMETENAQDEGRTRDIVDEDKEIEENILISTDGSKVSTDRQIEGTEGQIEGTEEHNEGTERQIKGTEEQNEGTEEKNEGTEEHNEGTEEQFESTDGQRK
ncbi:hypothetical protein Tco_0042170, partial [Tanacetum coccineum]